MAAKRPPTNTETLHTTTEHPFLTTDSGFVNAASLVPGEPVRQLDGSVGVVVAVKVTPGAGVRYNLTVQDEHTFAVGTGQWVVHNSIICDPKGEKPDHASDFDSARKEAFKRAGFGDPDSPNFDSDAVTFKKVDPATGTVVEFGGEDGMKVAYDSPHDDMDPFNGHDKPHVGYQTGGNRGDPGWSRGNITYDGPQHPFRSPIKGEGVI